MKISFLITLLIIALSINRLNAQTMTGNEHLAIQYFQEKNYEKALPLFTELINLSPDNAMYNYYYGVSLLKNNHYETATKEALLNAVVDKTPANVNFYLGNYFHALENWSEALDFYKRYNGTKLEKRQLEYDRLLSMCINHVNPFKVDKGDQKTIFVDTIKPIAQPDEKNFPIPDSLKTEWFNFQIDGQLTYHNIADFRSEAARILFAKAWIATGKNDSVVTNTDELRKAHEETNSVATRLALVQRIVEAEQLSYQLLKDRDKYFEQARVKENGYWEKAGSAQMAAFAAEIGEREKLREANLAAARKADEANRAAEMAKNQQVADTVKIKEDQAKHEPADLEPQDGPMIYKVQIGSFPNGKLTPLFKTKLAKLSKFRKVEKYRDAKNNEIYTIGNFNSVKDATTLKNQLIMEGMKGAYLAAFKNGERVPVVKESPARKK